MPSAKNTERFDQNIQKYILVQRYILVQKYIIVKKYILVYTGMHRGSC